MKYICALLLLLLQAFGSLANMASPIRPGARQGAVFSSRDIDILHETIRIEIGSDISRARYHIEYLLRSPEGMQIPLLFVAQDLEDSFKVWVDGRPQQVLPVPESYNVRIPQFFDGFEGTLGGDRNPINTTVIEWGPNEGMIYRPDELQYFETALSKGEHRITVSYEARAWGDVSDWLTKYTHCYSLSPARHWRSFGQLDIYLKAAFPDDIRLTTNLGRPAGSDSLAHWHFNQLPADYINIGLQPQAGSTARMLMDAAPGGFMGLTALILTSLHLYALYRFRRRYPSRKFSWVLIVGSLIVPFLILTSYVEAFPLVDFMIGPYASGRHGYIFLVYLFYPFLLIFYFLLLWMADRMIRKRLTSNSSSFPHS